MDFELTEEHKQFRGEVEAFLKEALPPDWDERVFGWPGAYGSMPHVEEEFRDFVRDFQRKAGQRGWHSLGWPERHGGQGSWMKQAIVVDTMDYHRAPLGGVADAIAAPTILAVASEEMKRQWLPRIARGEIGFWLGYSEPNAGSDLASIRTTAVDEGDHFVVNGQKIWSTGAHVMNYAWIGVICDFFRNAIF